MVILDKNIDFILLSVDFLLYLWIMEKKFKNNYKDRVIYFSKLFVLLKEKYDFVVFDLLLIIFLIFDSVLYVLDWVLIIF